MMRGTTAALSLALSVLAATAVHAQSQAELVEAISGDWYAFDPARASGDAPCRLTLLAGDDGTAGALPAEIAGCDAPLDRVAGWNIDDGQLVLAGDDGQTLARLGGSQIRMTGDLLTSGAGLILERRSGSASAGAFASALRTHRCVYVGYTDRCATRSQLREPVLADEGGLSGKIDILVRLNVRTQPRADASLLGTVPAGACITVDDCVIASDGVWCRAGFGEEQGWLRKTALRQDEWPVVTYLDGCESSEGS